MVRGSGDRSNDDTQSHCVGGLPYSCCGGKWRTFTPRVRLSMRNKFSDLAIPPRENNSMTSDMQGLFGASLS